MSTSDQSTGRGPSFSAYILLSEPIQFDTFEIRMALREDYPALDIGRPGMVAMPDVACDTAQFVTAPLFLGGSGKDDAIATVIRLPGYGIWALDGLSPRQHRMVPDMADVLARNVSYICVSVSAKSDALTDTFRAARLCSCLAAVFARLPVALAIYWETAGHFLPPAQVTQMADQAVADDWPVMSWLGFEIGQVDLGAGVVTHCATHGLLPFKGYEISLVPAPLTVDQAFATVATAVQMVTERGHVFRDGETLGRDGQSPAQSLRIRRVPGGTRKGVANDMVLLVHPDGPLPHTAYAGPLDMPVAPGQVIQKRGQDGLFKRLMRGMRAS